MSHDEIPWPRYQGKRGSHGRGTEDLRYGVAGSWSSSLDGNHSLSEDGRRIDMPDRMLAPRWPSRDGMTNEGRDHCESHSEVDHVILKDPLHAPLMLARREGLATDFDGEVSLDLEDPKYQMPTFLLEPVEYLRWHCVLCRTTRSGPSIFARRDKFLDHLKRAHDGLDPARCDELTELSEVFMLEEACFAALPGHHPNVKKVHDKDDDYTWTIGDATLAADSGYYSEEKTRNFDWDNCSVTDSILTDGRGNGIQGEVKTDLVMHFARHLAGKLEPCTDSQTAQDEASSLLRSFAVLLEQRAYSPMETAACTFIRHQRVPTARQISRLMQEDDRIVHPPSLPKLDVRSWLSDVSGNADVPPQRPYDEMGDHDDEEDETDKEFSFPTEIESAVDFAIAGEEFRWLLHEIDLATSTMQTGSTPSTTREKLLQSIEHRELSQLSLRVDWRPLAFLAAQYPDRQIEQLPSFGDCIVYCGAGDSVEAMTCGTYVKRVWQSTGEALIKSLDDIVQLHSLAQSNSRTPIAPAHSDILLEPRDDCLHAIISGSAIFRLQAAEALVWLGAACQASPHSSRAAYCSPVLTTNDHSAAMELNYSYAIVDWSLRPDLKPEGTAELGESVQQAETHQSMASCWLSIVRNPTIVQGYPISRRLNNEKGLEISLDMLATLSHMTIATVFASVTVMRGLCSMLVATRQHEGSICWHYLLDEEMRPICYSKAMEAADQHTESAFSLLSHSRHFVGWSLRAKGMIGTSKCNYNVDFSGVDFSPSGLGLEGVTVGASATKYLTVSTKIVPGNKDTIFSHSISDCYPLQLHQAATLRVVLYDAGERRGWLVDGNECLLHLSRSYLSSKHGPLAFGEASQRLVESFAHRDNTKGDLDSAMKVLLHPTNQLIDIYEGLQCHGGADAIPESHRLRFPKLVSHFYEVLWQIKGHFEMLRRSQRWTIGASSNCLDGFDVVELVALESTLHPRGLKLGNSGKEWLPLTNHLGAINLFGTDYGQLIRASDPCTHFAQLPSGVDLLATSLRLLQARAKSIRGEHVSSLEVMEGRYWNSSAYVFDNAQCVSDRYRKPSGSPCPSHVVQLDCWRAKPLQGHRGSTHQDLFARNPTAAVMLGCTAEMRNAISAEEDQELQTTCLVQSTGDTPPAASTTSEEYSTSVTLLSACSSTQSSKGSTAPTSFDCSSSAGSVSSIHEECAHDDKHDRSELVLPFEKTFLEVDLSQLSINELQAEIVRRLEPGGRSAHCLPDHPIGNSGQVPVRN